jgi:hypothetical protein
MKTKRESGIILNKKIEFQYNMVEKRNTYIYTV